MAGHLEKFREAAEAGKEVEEQRQQTSEAIENAVEEPESAEHASPTEDAASWFADDETSVIDEIAADLAGAEDSDQHVDASGGLASDANPSGLSHVLSQGLVEEDGCFRAFLERHGEGVPLRLVVVAVS